MQPRAGSLGLKAFLISFLCIVGVACVVAGTTYSLGIWGGKVIPDVVGMTQDEAIEALKASGFKIEIEEVASDEEPQTVLACDPQPGTKAEEGSFIHLSVAVTRSIPNVVGMSLDEAKEALSTNGFENIEVVEKSSDKTQGEVLSQDPKSGTKAKTSDKVSLTVATPYVVPDVNGLSETEAKSQIASVGYKYFITEQYSQDVAAGRVISTVPAAGEACATSQTVEIIVAKSRASEVEAAAKDYLSSLYRISVNGRNYEISSVDDITYEDGGTCAYTLNVKPYESRSWFGGEPTVRYGNDEQISGTLTLNDSNEVVSSDPEIVSQ